MSVPDTVLGDLTLTDVPTTAGSSRGTAKKAKQMLQEADKAFRDPTSKHRRAIAAAFAARNYVVYGQAFDLVRLDVDIDLGDAEALQAAIDEGSMTLVEVKSTNRPLDENFSNYFFGLSTAELLVAQSLKSLYRFAFVNTNTRAYSVVTLQQVLARAKAIYPTWSIRFDDHPFG